ncbi:MAG TPA: hypothetical protein VF647_16795 [Longimicrobium sp.]
MKSYALCFPFAFAVVAFLPQPTTVDLYAARDGTLARGTAFVAGETVVLRVENNTAGTIHYRSDPRQREVSRGEDLSVQGNDGGRWTNAVQRAYIDESPVRCIELRPGMNATRAWTPRTPPPPGTYRVRLAFATTAAGCASERASMREIHSAPFTLATGFRVTRVAAAAAVGPTGTCPVQVTFTGTVQATGPGTVRYQWERSDGAVPRAFSINFTAAGTRTVRSTWTLGAAGRETSGWQRLRLLEPHANASDPATFRFRCGA